ncbi:MAG TPA: FAD-binding protein, partial [Chitinophagales bacterium]|nr:FAD-binding protein [Chitinophagales bacterium]
RQITAENPYERPMRIYPAVHYTMGGLWVDYELMTTVPGLYALGECNFSDHGANRLGASALMQGLADGYFVIPYTIGSYLAGEIFTKAIPTDHPAFEETEKHVRESLDKLLSIQGTKSVDHYHKELGKIMWDYCGMARTAEGLKQAREMVKKLRAEFWQNVRVTGKANEFNQDLEKAMRVADFIELGELMIVDAYERNESCGGHFRTEFQEEGEAKRNDDEYAYVAAWEFRGVDNDPAMHKEELKYETVKLATRSYK